MSLIAAEQPFSLNSYLNTQLSSYSKSVDLDDKEGTVRTMICVCIVAGYNVDEAEFVADDDHSMTVNDIKTTGVDPYNTGRIDLSDIEKSVA